MIITFFSRPFRTLEKVGSGEEAEDAANICAFWGNTLFFTMPFVIMCLGIFGPSGYALIKLGIFIPLYLISKVCNDLADAFRHLHSQGTITEVENPRWWQRKWRLDPLPPRTRSR